jgi:2-polyprenyl-6-methoxyphenol hydroxylase-like FAD-dependent oxidoreductase
LRVITNTTIGLIRYEFRNRIRAGAQTAIQKIANRRILSCEIQHEQTEADVTLSAKHGQALVIGSSIAGLLAARVLSDYFEQVTIIERDELPDEPAYRAGVPQAHHGHILLARGLRVLEDLFPGFSDELRAAGANEVNLGRDTVSLTAGGWLKRFDGSLYTFVLTRILLEWQLRRRVTQIPNIRFVPEMAVDGLTATADRAVVTGIEATSRRDHTRQTFSADLVVDASGRKSKAPEWLGTLGYAAPEETHVNSYLGYATRWYEAVPGYDWQIMLIGARLGDNGQLRGGGILAVEGDRWLVTLAGMNKDYPPTDEVGFLEFAHSMASTAVYDAIKDATPISPVYGYRYEGRPEHFILMGDAVCGFNPVYGQGMTVAALEAWELGQLLAERGTRDLTGFAAQFQRALLKTSEDAWLMATGEDLRFPGTQGDRPGALARFVQRYLERMLAVMPYDEVLSAAFLETANLMKPPASLLHPRLALRVLRHSLFGHSSQAAQNAPQPRSAAQPAGD